MRGMGGAYVTGGTRGIGFAVAKRLVEEGYDVSVCGSSAESVAACRAASAAQALNIHVDQTDVTDPEALRQSLVAAAERSGDLKLVVCCAGQPVLGNAATLSLADWDRCLNLNLRSAFATVQAALDPLRASGESAVVFIASIWARVTGSDRVAYTTAKTALTGLARALAVDHAKDGIRFNCVAPGYVETELLHRSLAAAGHADVEKELERIRAGHPLGRTVSVDDVADAVAFLGGPRARSITGQTLYVDGGVSIRFAGLG
ncbi:SDR family NAD(P)-dependent oxidoreductase [Rhodoligotrophos defluvii]|uniref:SDR family NAD(P)-dependent oxidoreductase n=1 Tax=Rhodoligotrophos defluvii TaxID=2561934 RepID=UPI001484CD80|nr:SDR family NAD(P)-dependent oxidoreductase [Rhodoligotrophos defluvii]